MYWCILSRRGAVVYEKPYRIAWMNVKWINIHIAEIHLHPICGTDVYVGPCTLYPPTHWEDRAYRQSRTKGSLLWGGGGWGGSLQLLHFVAPGGTMTAAEDILWYIVREAFGQNAEHNWWKSDILFEDHVGDTQKPVPAFLKPDFKFTVYFPRWWYDLSKDVELKLLSICDVRFLSAKACAW